MGQRSKRLSVRVRGDERLAEQRAKAQDRAVVLARKEAKMRTDALAKEVKRLARIVDRSTGRAQGSSSTWAVVVSVGALALALFFHFVK